MKDEEIRIAIAEACGWRQHQCNDQTCWINNDDAAKLPVTGSFGDVVPDYPHDLNAMHSAVRSLPAWKQAAFAAALSFRAGERDCFVHELTAQDWADSFLIALHSKRESINSTP